MAVGFRLGAPEAGDGVPVTVGPAEVVTFPAGNGCGVTSAVGTVAAGEGCLVSSATASTTIANMPIAAGALRPG